MMKTLISENSEAPPTPRNPMTLLTDQNSSPSKKKVNEYIGNGLISARDKSTPLKGGAGSTLIERNRKASC